MRRVATFAAVWIAAAVVAVAVAWQGVGIVTRQVTDDRPAALSADDVRDLAGRTTAAPPTATTVPPASVTTPPASSAPRTSPPTSAPAPTATTAPGAAAETRTYNLDGGSVALRYAPEGVTVVWATPKSGFEVEIEPENVNGVSVRFESETHRSRVDGWWAGGPQDRVREEAR